MSKGLYIGLASILFLSMIGALALFNTWQVANMEERLIENQEFVRGLKQDIAAINNYLRRSGGGAVAAGSHNAAAAATVTAEAAPGEQRCEGNLLGPPNHYLPEDAEFGGSLTRAVIAGSKGFNIITESGADVQEIYTYVGGAIAERNWENPDLWSPRDAWCVQVNDDRTVYTIKLRPDILWHPIQPVYLERSPWLEGEHTATAHDYKFAMDMIMDPAVEGAAPLRTYYQDYDHLEVVNDHEFKVHWKRKVFQSKTFTLGFIPMPRWIYGFDPDGNPYPPEVIGQNFNQHWYRHMVGTGAYMFDSFEENSYIRLTRNNNYHDELPAFDEVVFRVVGNPDQQLAQLEAGDLDFILMQPAQYKKEILAPGASGKFTNELDASGSTLGGKFGFAVFPRMAYRYIGWNADGPFFGDKLVRRAMTHALNRDLLLKEVFMGLGVLTSGNFYPLSPEYDASVQLWPFDLDAAAALLDQAGWRDTNGNGIRDKDGLEFEFTFLVYGYRAEFIAMAEFYKEDLKKVGVDMTISPVDWPTMQTKVNNKEFDAFTGGWALSWETDPYQIWHSSQADVPEGSNRVGFRNPRADAIIEEARETFDLDRRVALFHEFHQLVHEEQPYTFFFSDLGVGAWQPSMRNVVFQKVRPHDLSLPWFKHLP